MVYRCGQPLVTMTIMKRAASMNRNKRSYPIYFLILANAAVLGTLIFAAVLETEAPDFYYFSIQEDEYIEWASFWAFLGAAAAAVWAGRVYARQQRRFPWYLYGLALFSFLIAMEEISWGQRVLGYRPPVYFLEHNYQQELNIHNVIDTDYRKLVLMLSILGYGVVLPLLALPRAGRQFLERVGIVAPAPGLVPAFAATFLLYYHYPLSFSGEWVEFMLGTGILLSLLPELNLLPTADEADSRWRSLPFGVVAAFAACLLLGLATSAASRAQRDAHPATMEAARSEIEAIKRDFESGRVQSRCNVHKRLYTFANQYRQENLLRGEFAALQAQGLPEERAGFLIDPWNSPYWLRDRCEAGSRVVFIYSFGPNRRRDSTELEIREDDVGAYLQLR